MTELAEPVTELTVLLTTAASAASGDRSWGCRLRQSYGEPRRSPRAEAGYVVVVPSQGSRCESRSKSSWIMQTWPKPSRTLTVAFGIRSAM